MRILCFVAILRFKKNVYLCMYLFWYTYKKDYERNTSYIPGIP